MPQYMKIKVEDKLVGLLKTGNTGGTRYNIQLCVPEIENTFFAVKVDTGIRCQPNLHTPEVEEDWKNDFAHTRRCIACAVASYVIFSNKLQERSPSEPVEIKPIDILLMTNEKDRGTIEIEPVDANSVNVTVIIGKGLNRVEDPIPIEEFPLRYIGVNISGSLTQTERVLKALHSIHHELLQSLKEQMPD